MYEKFKHVKTQLIFTGGVAEKFTPDDHMKSESPLIYRVPANNYFNYFISIQICFLYNNHL